MFKINLFSNNLEKKICFVFVLVAECTRNVPFNVLMHKSSQKKEKKNEVASSYSSRDSTTNSIFQ